MEIKSNIRKRDRSFFGSGGTFLDEFLQKARIRKVKKYMSGSLVCDLGCGRDGFLLSYFSDLISGGVGFDVEVDERINNEKIKLCEVDLNEVIPSDDCVFDVVTSLAVIEHLENFEQHMKEACRILKEGGVLILTTPNPKGRIVLEFLANFGIVNRAEIQDHKRYFDRKWLLQLAREAGFSEIKTSSFQCGMNNLIIAKK